LTRTSIAPNQLVHFAVPGAVTVVPVDAWGRPIDSRSVRKIDQQRLASVNSTLDPLTLTPLRNAVIHSAWGRGKIDLPPGIAKKLNETRVFVSSDVKPSKFHKDKSMRVEPVPATARNQKFKVKDQREETQQAETGRKPEVDKAGKQDMGRVTAEARKDTKETQQQTRQLEQQQRKETRAQEKAGRVVAPAQAPAQQKAQPPVQQKAERQAQPQPQGQRVGKPAKAESKPQTQAAPKQERKQGGPPAAQGQGGGGGKGKGKKP
jgi:hypothetical protein